MDQLRQIPDIYPDDATTKLDEAFENAPGEAIDATASRLEAARSDPTVDAVSGSSYEMLEFRPPARTSPERASAAAPAHLASATSPLANPRAATYVVTACVALLVVLTMLGGVLNVGDHLMAAHPVLGWVFYLLIAVVVAVGIVYPMIRVARRPVFSLYQLRDETGHAKRRRCRMLVDNLVANTDLTDEEIARLEEYLLAGDAADDLLIAFFNEKCVPAIDAETKRAATTAFFASAISRSPLIATVTMLSVCLDLVRAIVERCGFRPTNLGLARLYSRVMLSALVAGGIEDSDLSDLLGTLLGGGAGARVGGILLGSATEGLVSAFLVFRVGVITKDWLTSADGPAKMSSIRRMSYRQALTLMRTSGFMATVADVVKRNMGTVASSAASSAAAAAKSAAGASVNAARNAAGAAMEVARSAGDATMGAVRTAAASVADVTRNATEAGRGVMRSAADFLTGTTRATVIEAEPDRLPEQAESLDAEVSVLPVDHTSRDAGRALARAASQGVQTAQQAIGGAASTVRDAAVGSARAVRKTAGDAGAAAKGALDSAVSRVKNLFK